MKDISDLLYELYGHVTPKGRKILDKLVSKIIFELECISQTIILEEDEDYKKERAKEIYE